MNNEQKKQTAVFGGSFDPPHCAHVMAVAWMLSCAGICRVIIVPCFRHAFDKPSRPFQDRLEMCRLAFSVFGGQVTVSDIESTLPLPSYTVNTLKHLAALHPDEQLRLVVGSDILTETDRWRDFDTVSRIAPPLVMNRTGFDTDSSGPVFPMLSSTEIRSALCRGETPYGLVPDKVIEYIHSRGLYRCENAAGDPGADRTL